MPIEALRTPDERFAILPGFPYAPRYVDDLAGYESLRRAYVDEGPADAETAAGRAHSRLVTAAIQTSEWWREGRVWHGGTGIDSRLGGPRTSAGTARVRHASARMRCVS